mmetsp:Transcript_86723/g.201789  ORF Transcript_86723/g.201789 Transcript_86723/m.201789 type:complete len:423 (+) Transcript_86723:38-1306(+)|eukprot:CAMPEP_0171093948 /NCGR_PEP_ID=MMETSP0766_2-20121228/39368_1 /TAXON_ID=439317 /ORGANISM="Gambierdiscus australes, Strain CAWD 149" /LENGTH=422 /DNA_ID=CAMNT_0011552459 /DNA_START=37 /DNA_END=1305 /DNA_ORIENTATION=+
MAHSATAERIQELGLQLSVEAAQALDTLPQEHSWELLDIVKSKAEGGHIKNPSNYICATIARGYVPQADGGAMVASIARAGGTVPPMQSMSSDALKGRLLNGIAMPSLKRGSDGSEDFGMYLTSGGFDNTASELAASRGMMKAQQAGLSLNDDAVKALLHLPPEHASELLENVADKCAVLRDPSNYIVATVARGFVPKVGPVTMAAQAAGNGAAVIPALRPAPAQSGPTSLVPSDLTPVESRVLEMNAVDLWGGQSINVETLLALRCVPQEQALQLLSSLEAKGRGKGSVNIQNPNNYVQAAVVKIKKGMTAENSWAAGGAAGAFRQDPSLTPPGQWNYTGNQSRMRAKELGLELHEDTLQALAKVPLKDANFLLEAASWVNAQDEDPNEYIQLEAGKMAQAAQAISAASEEVASVKKPRWG